MAEPNLPIEVPYPEQEQKTGHGDTRGEGRKIGLSNTHRGTGRHNLTTQSLPPQGWMRANEDA